jgi:prophage regulatory protein
MKTQTIQKHPVKFIRTTLVLDRSGLSKSTLRRRIQEGLFVPPCSLGERAFAFLELEVNTILNAMAAEKSTDEIKELVKNLVEQRQKLAA